MKKRFLFLILFFTFSAFTKEMHPYHVGYVEFKYNSKTKTFEVTGKFFLDDLENALNKKYGKAAHFNDKNYKDQINILLKNYCVEYLKIKVNNRTLKLNYLGYEENQESVDIYLETEPAENPKKVETSVSMLYNYFDDQLNIAHIIVGGVRKSSKLGYPNRYLFQTF
jgi:hypothetical protein